MLEELLKAGLFAHPFVAHFNTPSTVVLIGHMVGVVTTDSHHIPDLVLLLEVGLDCLVQVPTVGFRVIGTCDVVLGYRHALTTGTFNTPSLDEIGRFGLGIVSNLLHDSEFTELHA